MSFTAAEQGSTIAIVPLDNPEGPATNEKNPLITTTEKLAGKAVRISAAGKASQYWFPPEESARRIDVKVKSLPSCMMGDTNRNRPLRLLLKAYQALTTKEFTLTRELCTKASEVDPTLAAPFIITGLSWYQEGKRDQARVAFNKARALDPEDQEIGQLLRMVQ